MLLAYLDESFNKSRYWIAAVLCPDHQVQPLTEALDAVVRKASRAYSGVSNTAELHGHALFQGADDWSPLATMPRARIGVYHDALEAIAAHDVHILIRGVNVVNLNKRYPHPDHPHGVVLMHLLERIDEKAEDLGELAIVIADEVDRKDHYRRNLWMFQRVSTTGYRARKIERVIDTIHFAPSTSSRLVQSADMVAYLYCRIHSGADRDARAIRANEALWNRVSSRVCHVHCWHP